MPSCEKIDTSRRGLIAKNIFLRAFFKSQLFGKTRNFDEQIPNGILLWQQV